MTANRTVSGTAPLLERLRAEGLQLTVSDDRLRVQPANRVTPALRLELAARKPELLAVLSRLQGMHDTVGQVPIPCAVLKTVGGPGRCFSCGESLDHPESHGRCITCSLAVELFYRQRARSADVATFGAEP